MSETKPLLQDDKFTSFPDAPFARAVSSERGNRVPQAIGHRGYKALFPENSMAAVRGAVEAGAHGVEIDIHLSADGVVVLSHDPTLKRCFGVDRKVAECTWEYLSTLRTVREPREGVPRLRDVLEYLCQPGNEDVWIILDTKPDDDPDELLSATKTLLDSVTATTKPWDQRILVACWNARTIRAAHRHLPTHPASLISFNVGFASRFLPAAGLGFSMLHSVLGAGRGARFLESTVGRPAMAWTVNDESWMEWCVRKNVVNPGPRLLDAVITDDPKQFLQVCRRVEDEAAAGQTPAPGGLWASLNAYRQSLYTTVLGSLAVFVFLRTGRLDYFSDASTLTM